MRALFVTVAAHELYVPVRAWRNRMGPCGHITYSVWDPPNDEAILSCAKGYKPEVIWYIGAHDAVGLPAPASLAALRHIAPTIAYLSDTEDEVWWPRLDEYRREKCFDLIVSQTGVKHHRVDMATLMALDVDAFSQPAEKEFLCGFTGTANFKWRPSDPWEARGELITGLEYQLDKRPRDQGPYENYANFMKRCRICLNSSWTGTHKRHHVKWRTLETAWAESVLLEHRDSPAKKWFPEELYLQYSNHNEVKRIVANARKHNLEPMAKKFAAYCRERYMPEMIFKQILDAL